MKTEVEKFREAIESLYESTGYFTEKQLIKMKRLRKDRKKNIGCLKCLIHWVY